MLVPVLDPFDGPPQSHCRDADKKIFGVELAANPEPAAGIAFLSTTALVLRPNMRAMASRLRCGTLAAPYNSSTSPAASKRARACLPIARRKGGSRGKDHEGATD